jgi:t-SNARE complex subunit (syntaxin)
MSDKQRIDRLVIVVAILCFVVSFLVFMQVLS